MTRRELIKAALAAAMLRSLPKVRAPLVTRFSCGGVVCRYPMSIRYLEAI